MQETGNDFVKILQVNCIYNQGSTGKIVADIHHALEEQKIESIVCYGRGEIINEPNIYKICGEFYSHVQHFWANLTGLMYGGCFYSTHKLEKLILKEQPDVVHLHCLNGYFINIYRLISWLKKKKIKTILTMHAEFMYTANCGYALDCEKWKIGCGHCPRLKQETSSYFFDNTALSWEKMKRAFDGFNSLIITSVSPWLMKRAKESPFLSDKQHELVLNGLDTNIFHSYDTTLLKKKYCSENKKIILHVTPFFSQNKDNIKGGYYILKLAKQLETDNILFIVIGKYDEKIIPPKNLIFLGPIYDQNKLAQYYSLADVTLLTSKKETFSMVTAESLACGTPVVGFESGAPEQIALSQYSAFSKYGDLDAMKKNIYKILNSNFSGDISKEAFKKYNKEKMIQGYLDLYFKEDFYV